MAHRPSQPSVLVQQAATVAAPTDFAIGFAAITSGHEPYPRYRNDAPCGGWRDVHNGSARKTIQLPSGRATAKCYESLAGLQQRSARAHDTLRFQAAKPTYQGYGSSW